MTNVVQNFIQRAVTGILFILVIGAALILDRMTYAMMMTCVITLATNEFCKMLRLGGQAPHFFLALGTNLVAFTAGFLICTQGLDSRALLSIIGLIWLIFLVELFSKNEHPLQNIAMTMLCMVYIGLPFALFNLLAFKHGQYDYWPIIFVFILCWVNDTGAYLCGVTMGKHKLYERISPKKTIEGFIGGVLLTLVAGFMMYKYVTWLSLPLWFCLAMALITSVIGTCGDLIESMFKRSVDLKDSGRILPGHGGILDRFDAVMFVVPIISLLYYFFI